MKLCSLASGSSGNCIFVGSEHTSILVDAGISGKRIEQGLQSFGYTGKDIDALFITHEHIDHIKSLGVLARKYGLPIYATEATCRAIEGMSSMGKIPEGLLHSIAADGHMQIGDLELQPFSISHDAADPVGYRIESEGKSAGIATDMGMYNDYIISHLQYLDVLLLEANHDVHMLEVGRYPYQLKMRIMSDRGHLSNETSGQLLSYLLHDHMKHIILGHLSHENNYPDLAFQTVCNEVTMADIPYTSQDFPIDVAKRDTVGQMIEF